MTQYFKTDKNKLYVHTTKAMTPEEFMSASLGDLASITKIDRHRWCRYLNGQVPPNYKTIKQASQKLNMTTITLIECMEKRIKTGKVKRRCA